MKFKKFSNKNFPVGYQLGDLISGLDYDHLKITIKRLHNGMK